MKIVKIKRKKYVTPWGHEFSTQKELDAFISGMHYMSSNILNMADMSLHNTKYSKETEHD